MEENLIEQLKELLSEENKDYILYIEQIKIYIDQTKIKMNKSIKKDENILSRITEIEKQANKFLKDIIKYDNREYIFESIINDGLLLISEDAYNINLIDERLTELERVLNFNLVNESEQNLSGLINIIISKLHDKNNSIPLINYHNFLNNTKVMINIYSKEHTQIEDCNLIETVLKTCLQEIIENPNLDIDDLLSSEYKENWLEITEEDFSETDIDKRIEKMITSAKIEIVDIDNEEKIAEEKESPLYYNIEKFNLSEKCDYKPKKNHINELLEESSKNYTKISKMLNK